MLFMKTLFMMSFMLLLMLFMFASMLLFACVVKSDLMLRLTLFKLKLIICNLFNLVSFKSCSCCPYSFYVHFLMWALL